MARKIEYCTNNALRILIVERFGDLKHATLRFTKLQNQFIDRALVEDKKRRGQWVNGGPVFVKMLWSCLRDWIVGLEGAESS